MSNKKWESGTFIRIRFVDRTYGYGRLRSFPNAAFYNYRTDNPVSDLNKILSKLVLFSISIHESALNNWEIIGKKELEESLKQLPEQFMQDLGDFTKCTIYDYRGNERLARPEECIELERAAVWDAGGVEKRLFDELMGHPNKTTESMKVRLK